MIQVTDHSHTPYWQPDHILISKQNIYTHTLPLMLDFREADGLVKNALIVMMLCWVSLHRLWVSSISEKPYIQSGLSDMCCNCRYADLRPDLKCSTREMWCRFLYLPDSTTIFAAISMSNYLAENIVIFDFSSQPVNHYWWGFENTNLHLIRAVQCIVFSSTSQCVHAQSSHGRTCHVK